MSVPAPGNPLVAERMDSTTAITGIGVVESAVGLYDGVESGSWVEGGLGAAGAGLETLGLVLDPVGTLVSYGVAWLMEHVQPLSDALDWLAGDPDTIASYAVTWRNVAAAVQQAGADFGAAVGEGTAGWQGQAAEGYRAHTARQIEQLTAAGTGAQTVGSVVEGAGVLVGVVREVVRDLVAECVSTLIARIPQWLAEIGLTVGIATPHVVASAVALIARWVDRISEVIIKLTRSLGNLMPLIRRLDELFAGIRDGLSGAGRAAPSSPGGSSMSPRGPVTSPDVPESSTNTAPSTPSQSASPTGQGGTPSPSEPAPPGGSQPGRITQALEPDTLPAAADTSVDPSRITPDPAWRHSSEPVYRSDNRPPEEIFRDGFQPLDPSNTDLERFVQTNNPSAFVSTSTDADLYQQWGSDFRYTVQAPGGVDVNASLGRHVFEGEAEVAFPGGIDRRFIEGGHRVHDDSLGEWFANPHFDPNPR